MVRTRSLSGIKNFIILFLLESEISDSIFCILFTERMIIKRCPERMMYMGIALERTERSGGQDEKRIRSDYGFIDSGNRVLCEGDCVQ